MIKCIFCLVKRRIRRINLSLCLRNLILAHHGLSSIELSLLQRCGAHLASETDIEESFMAGKAAVENAVNGINGRMIGFERGVRDGRYACKTNLIPLMEVANVEKKIPREWINAEGNGVNHEFIEYALPLIQGEPDLPKVDSLPRFAKLKKILAK